MAADQTYFQFVLVFLKLVFLVLFFFSSTSTIFPKNDIQKELDNLLEWCREWKLNASKCTCLSISIYLSLIKLLLCWQWHYPVSLTTKRFGHHYFRYSELDRSSNAGLWKSIPCLRLIKRFIPLKLPTPIRKALFLSLVRSRLTYCSQLWRPSLIEDIALLEKVQRRTTKYISNDFTSDYKSRLLALNLLPLMQYYDLLDILFLIKCLNFWLHLSHLVSLVQLHHKN